MQRFKINRPALEDLRLAFRLALEDFRPALEDFRPALEDFRTGSGPMSIGWMRPGM
jgi:hypothetical protein